MIVALWLESTRVKVWTKVAIIAAITISTLPTPSSRWMTPADSPTFFATAYRQFLKPSDNVLTLPFGYRGSGMLWHAETEMYFKMVGGWTGAAPEDFYVWPITSSFGGVRYLPDPVEQFGALLSHFSVDVVTVSQSAPDASSWGAILTPLASSRERVAGVDIYRISAAAVSPYRAVTAQQMNQRKDEAVIDSLVLAASEWQPRNGSKELTPFSAMRQGLLKKDWFVGSTIVPEWISGGADRTVDTTQASFAGVLMDETPTGDLNVGLADSYAALEPVIAKYRTTASHVYFPYPVDLLAPGTAAPKANDTAILTLVFSREQLARAALSLKNGDPPKDAVTVRESAR